VFDSIFILLAMLFVKHWYIDFVNQSAEEVAGKGTYGNAHGLMHSIKHGVATFIIFWAFALSWPFAVIVGFLDFVTHYHIDWAKMNINKRWGYTIEQPAFWAWLGADQLAHSLTYITLVWMTV
jgi:hypothetical protein